MATESKKKYELSGWTVLLMQGLRAGETSARIAAGFEVGDGIINIEGRKADVLNTHNQNTPSLNKIINLPTLNQIPSDSTLTDSPNYKQYKQQIVLVNDSQSPVIQVALQTIPSEIREDGNTQWNQVRGMGMNNPFQIYTGSEDTLSFEISWYATNDRDRSDVINKCRLLQAWSKADGYKSSPPVIKVVWGDSDLFSEDQFIVSSAGYKLTNFQKFYKDKTTKEVVNLGLYPNVAVQQITLKKVSFENQTHESIVKESDLRKTPGVRYY